MATTHTRRRPQINGSRVLVTGGAGTIGSTLVDLLIERGAAEIIVLDNFTRGTYGNLTSALARGPVTVVEGDVRDVALVRKLSEGIDIVFHQAAIRITQCAEDPRLALEVLADGTYNVLEAAVSAGVARVVAASSASVYGQAERFPTDESHHPYDNATFYGAAKLFNEGMLRSFHEMQGLEYVALRYFNVYGPRMDIYGLYTEVLVRWMEQIAAGKPPVILGDGTQTMDFIFTTDVARANVLAAESVIANQVFNIASGVETSLNELAATLLDVMGSSLTPEHGPARRVNAVRRRLAQTVKAHELLGFRADVDLRQGLRELVTWWQEQHSASGLPLARAGEGR